MPITQERIISLISAARDFEQALDRVLKTIHIEWNGARETRQFELALDNIVLYAGNKFELLKNPILSTNTLTAEETHFRSHKSRNESERRRQERRRRREGAKPFQSTPLTKPFQPDYLEASPESRSNAPHQIARQGAELINDIDLEIEKVMDPTLAADLEFDSTAFDLTDNEPYNPTDAELSRLDPGTVSDEEIAKGLRMQENLERKKL